MARRKKQPAGPAIGHNSNLNQDEKIKLSGFIAEIERLEADAREINSERGIIYKSAKEAGFDTKALKHVIRMKRMENSKRNEFENAVDAYTMAMGDFVTTPLGQAGMPHDRAGYPADDLEQAITRFGTPTELTEDEKAKGYTSAFIKDGNRAALKLDTPAAPHVPADTSDRPF